MMRLVLLAFILTLFTACSFKSKPNEWKYNSINAFSSYTKNFLSNNDALANSDLNRAVDHAKQSANLTQLSRIYLGECALNISVGIDDDCSKYKDIANLVRDKSLESYYAFVSSSLKLSDIKMLDSKYKDFAENLINNNYKEARKNVLNMDKITSKLLSASLIKDELSFDEVSKLINDASFYGYKKSIIFWLKIQKTKTTIESKKEEIDKKIKVLG